MHRLLMIFTLLIVLSSTAMAGSLEFDEIGISVDGDNILSTSGTSGSLDVEPGDELRVRIKLENTFDHSSENDILDVRVRAVIDDIDDGDDIDDSDIVDVRADSYKVVYLKLNIPDDASSYESYHLDISADGTDEADDDHSATASFDLDVKRERHEILFETLRMDDVYCDRDPYLRVELQNTGEEDEFDVELEVSNRQLGSVYHDTFDLEAVNSGDDSYYNLDKRLDLDALSPGTHELNLRLEFNNGREVIHRTIYFDVESCGQSGRSYESATDSTSNPGKEVHGETFENPRRDLSSIYGDEDIPVELFMPDGNEPTTPLPKAQKKDSTFSIAVLVLANIVILVFIALLLYSLWYRYS